MFDLVVVGAGFSGLQAAYVAQQAGLSVAVLEARDRVGGKSWSVPLSNGRGVADMGAAWVNDTLQPRVWSYIKQFGLEGKIVKQRLGEKAVLMREDGGRTEFPQGTTPEVRKTPCPLRHLSRDLALFTNAVVVFRKEDV